MEIVNPSGLPVGVIGGRAYFPDHSLTVVVKGTYDLVPDEAADLAEEQMYPTGEEPFEDDGEPAATLRYPSDFAFYKPRADLLLVGSARAPGGHPVPHLPVGVRIGEHSKILVVSGDRWLRSDAGRREGSAPEPFSEMPLRYENAFGGAGFAYNPAGKGYTEVEDGQGGRILPRPNVEYPREAADSPDDLPFPAGFAPLPPAWRTRAGKVGTYDEAWLERRWPWFPEDFDWGYFNAAPPDMQAEGFLRGDEPVRLENLDPELPHFTSRLPGVRVRCFLDEVVDDEVVGDEVGGGTGGSSPEEEDPGFREVPMNLDTLWIDADVRRLVLVWRGVIDVRSEEYEEVRHLLVLSEGLDEEPRGLDACRRELEDLLAAEAAAAERLDIDTFLPPVEPPHDAELDQEVAESLEQMNQELAAQGLATVQFPPEEEAPSPPPLDDELQGPLSRADVEARRDAGEDLTGLDLTGADLEGIDLSGADLGGALLTRASLRGALLNGTNLAKARVWEADLTGASLRGARLDEADLTDADLGEADLTGASLAGATLEDARLGQALLDGVQGEDAMFPGADLTGVTAVGADLVGANLSGARLEGADFREADLSEACLEGAMAVAADFSAATLRELQGDGADFSRASFREAHAPEAIWSDATLVEADLVFCHAEGADFTGADLSHATLTGANLKSARLVRATLSHAVLYECDLFEGSLEKAVLEETDLRGANLYGAEVLDARFEGAYLEGANLKMTKLDPR